MQNNPSSADTAGSHFVFVYGTLKRGERNHAEYLDVIGARYIGVANTVRRDFTMVAMPSASSPGKMTPSVFIHPEGHSVEGEVFFVTESILSKLDNLERQYKRIKVHLGMGMRAWMYVKEADAPPEPADTPYITVNPSNGAHRWCEMS